jgi:hypothetical protein
MNEIKTIPTKYNGTQFRSRLEARWAVVFDELGLTWYYEYEGFDLSSGWYLPDFYLPDLEYRIDEKYIFGVYVEIKPQYPTDEQMNKMYYLVEMVEKMAFLNYGLNTLDLIRFWVGYSRSGDSYGVNEARGNFFSKINPSIYTKALSYRFW